MEYVTKAGTEVPKVGVGTWQMATEVAYESVSTALEEGYRHVDTAQLYENERGVGRAIEESGVERSEVFLTTKVNPTHRSVDDIVDSARKSVERLGVDQIDLLLIHWPHPLADLPTVIDGLDECVRQDLTRFIGVSNFGVERLERAQQLTDTGIFTNQVLFHPWWPQRELLSYCQQEDVILTGYSPLANGGAIDDELLADLGRKYGKSGPQVAIRWATQHENVITIPMSTSREHLADNVDIFDFKLTRAEHEQVTRPSYLQTGLSMVRGQLGV